MSMYTTGCTVERIGHNLQGDSLFRRLTGGNARWASRHWGDKVVQQAVVTILNQIYEVDFKGFSYRFRPGRSPHQRLDALTVGIQPKKVNWVLDADIRGFFHNMSREWSVKFIEHRMADRRILRLIQRCQKPCALEDGRWSETKLRTPQGAVVLPLIANVYTSSFHKKWIEGQNPDHESLLGTGDIQSLADLGNSYSIVDKMKPIPIDPLDLLHLIVASLLPMAPLLLRVMPLGEFLKLLLKVVA